jgi:pimeloyl-ACP methyl ester carboxylesterase
MSGIIAAIREIGECYVVAHSHGAALIMDALGTIKELIRKLVVVEPGATGVAAKLLGEIPSLLVWGDYLDTHSVWPLIRKPYEGVPVQTLNLPDVGLTGNTHFPMLDKNSDEVFQRILQWLES